MLKVIIEKADENANTRQITTGAGPRTVLEQFAYVHLSGHRYPVRAKFTVPEAHNRPYPAGTYTVAPESFRIGKYEKLELNPFELFLIPMDTPK